MNFLRPTGDVKRMTMCQNRTVWLQKEQGLLWNGIPQFLGVIRIITTDANDLHGA